MAELSVVGKSVIKVDAFGKVTGKTKYASDEGIGIPGMLYGKVLFSPYAHARVLNIDTSKAGRLKGVRAVITGKDTPDHRTGSLIEDRHILCHETVRFAGDAFAVVIGFVRVCSWWNLKHHFSEILHIFRKQYSRRRCRIGCRFKTGKRFEDVRYRGFSVFGKPQKSHTGWCYFKNL